MAETETKSWTFLKGVGGVVGTVIAAVLGWHFTHPPTPTLTPASIATPETPSVALNGIVADAATHQLLRRAGVTVTLGANSVHQDTSDDGQYHVSLPAIGTTQSMGRVDIKAAGYTPYSNSISLQPGDRYYEITLDAIPVPPVATPAATPGVTAATSTIAQGNLAFHANMVLKPTPPNFINKVAVQYAGHH